MTDALNGIDRLRLWQTDPETFHPIDLDDAEEILTAIDTLVSALKDIAYTGKFAGDAPEVATLAMSKTARTALTELKGSDG